MTKPLIWTRTEQGELTAKGDSEAAYVIRRAMSAGYDLLTEGSAYRWFRTEVEAQEAAQKYEDE